MGSSRLLTGDLKMKLIDAFKAGGGYKKLSNHILCAIFTVPKSAQISQMSHLKIHNELLQETQVEALVMAHTVSLRKSKHI